MKITNIRYFNHDNSLKKNIFSKTVFQIFIIIIIGLSLRFYFLPYNVPITLDGLLYFWYASDVIGVGIDTSEYNFPNNFWPLVISVFFELSNSDNFLELMNIQRILSITFSVLTIIPLFILIRKFFDKKYALIGIFIFSIEPRIIQNSIMGLPEAMFIFFGILTITLFLSNNIKQIYLSFIFAAIFTITRYEGILIIIPLILTFLIRYRKHKNIYHIFGVLVIFFLVLAPMIIFRTELIGSDGIFSSTIHAVKISTEPNQEKVNFELGIKNFFWMVGLSTFPMFFLLIPYGIFSIFKKKYDSIFIIIFSLVFLIPTFYAGIRGLLEIKYLLILTPIYILFSLFILEKFDRKIKKDSAIFGCILIFLLVSFLFLEQKIDNQYEREAMIIAEEISKRTSIINDYHPESIYLRTIGFLDYSEYSGKRQIIMNKINVLLLENYSNLNELLKDAEMKKMEFLISDNNPHRVEYIKKIYENENQYPFLEKVFDSNDFGFKYKVKIFKINYDNINFEPQAEN